MNKATSVFEQPAADAGPRTTPVFGDGAILLSFGIILLLLLMAMALLSFDMASGTQYSPTLFGP